MGIRLIFVKEYLRGFESVTLSGLKLATHAFCFCFLCHNSGVLIAIIIVLFLLIYFFEVGTFWGVGELEFFLRKGLELGRGNEEGKGEGEME